MHNTPILKLEPSRSDRYVADARRRALRRDLTRYIPEAAADALLEGRPVDLDVAPEHEASILALMPKVAAFVRENIPAPLPTAA